jgi:hypothetical protein
VNAQGRLWTRLWDPRTWWKLIYHSDEKVRREAWGYVFWIPLIFLLFLPAELIPAIWGTANWPTFSTTIGHLEYLWGPVGLFVIWLMVFTAVNAIARRRLRQKARDGKLTKAAYRIDPEGGRLVWRQRTTPTAAESAALAPAPPPGPRPAKPDDEVPMSFYLPGGAALIAAGAAVAFIFGGYWPGAYVLWTLVAFFVLVLPSILAFFYAKLVPFPTLFQTVANLRGHVHLIGTAVLAFLAALALHLSFYPWPNTAHALQVDHRIAPSISGRAVRGGTITVSGTVENCPRPEKVVVRSSVFPDGGTVTAPVKDGHYTVRVRLASTPRQEDTVEVSCGRPQVGVAEFP